MIFKKCDLVNERVQFLFGENFFWVGCRTVKMTILKKPGACARSWHPVLGGRQNVHLDIGFWGFPARAFFQNTICPKARHFFFRNQVFLSRSF